MKHVLLVLAVLAASCRPVPTEVRDAMARAPRGSTPVVFFTDFQCPFCRRTHAALASVIDARGGGVEVVYFHVPLRMHPNARDAARAAVCVEAIAKERLQPFARELAETSDLSEAGCASLALGQGVPEAPYRRCIADTSTDARIDRDRALFQSIDGEGVPLLFIGDRRLEGSQSGADIADALDAARR